MREMGDEDLTSRIQRAMGNPFTGVSAEDNPQGITATDLVTALASSLICPGDQVATAT